MLLSIIVPVYNMAAEGKLRFCLDSLTAQTIEKKDYEIIAVDDASTDESLEILKEYAQKYEGLFKVLHHEVNRRQGGAKNTGLEAASGEWIGFVDSDDWVSPDFYEKLLEKAKKTGADMVGCGYSLVDTHTFQTGEIIEKNNDDSQTGILDLEKHKKLFIKCGSMVVKIYRSRIIREYGLCFPERIFYEDNCAGPLWSLYFTHFERVDEPLYYYYQHDSSTVHHISEEKCRDRMTAAMALYDACSKAGFLEEYRRELEIQFTRLYYANTLFTYMQGVKKPQLSFVRKLRMKMDELFPDFEKNPYYPTEIGEMERKLIRLQGRSNLIFFLYYRFKLWVWGKQA